MLKDKLNRRRDGINKEMMGRILSFQDNNEFKEFLIKSIKVDKNSIPFFLDKRDTYFVLFKQVSNQIANIIKQEMISSGGDAAVSEEVGRFKKGKGDILIIGNKKVLKIFIEKSRSQSLTVTRIGREIEKLINLDEENKFIVGKRIYRNSKNYIMGILNVTPDSFYDGGKYIDKSIAIERALKLVEDGADIIDIGGESSRPGSEPVKIEDELNRVLPVLRAIRKEIKVPISVDTYKSKVAEIVLSEGADIINDISGLRFDKNMAKVISRHKASVIIMHIKGTPKNMQNKPEYKDLIEDIITYLKDSIDIALRNNIDFNKIMIDPGIGFGKKLEHNYIILNKLKEFKILNRPILIGLSRKSLIGKVLNNNPEKRLNGTLVLNSISLLNGANFIRVHDVKEHKEILKLIEYYREKGFYS